MSPFSESTDVGSAPQIKFASLVETVEALVNRDPDCNEQSQIIPTYYEWDKINNNGKDADLQAPVQLPTKLLASKTPEYHPNIENKRVFDRCNYAIYGISGLFNNGPCRHNRMLIDSFVGHQSNKLSKWLREVLIITTDDFYSKDAKLCKEHDLNKDGVRYLKNLIDGKLLTPWNQYQLEQQTKKQHELSVKFSHVSEENEQENLEKCSISDGLEYLEKEFGTALRSENLVYFEKTNRYWNRLQNVPHEIRNPFLAKNGYCYDYDIRCCNVTLIMQYAEKCLQEFKKTNPGKKAPVLRNGAILQYMHARTAIREQIAKELGIPIKVVKEVITALVNGASLRNRYGKLFHKLGSQLASSFYKIELIRNFVDNIKSCWECILTYDDRRQLTTRKGRNGSAEVVVKARLSSKQKANIYFELEKNVLDAAVSYILKTGYGVFKIHDGWVTNNLLDTYELKAHIKKQTGFTIDADFKLLAT